MSKSAQKLYQRLQQTKAGWTPREMKTLFRGSGFRHWEVNHGVMYEHPDHPDWATITVPRHKELRKWVPKDALRLLKQLVEVEGPEVIDP